MRIIHRIFFIIMLFIVPLIAHAQADSKLSKTQVEKLTREVNDLKGSLETFQSKLSNIVKKLEPVAPMVRNSEAGGQSSLVLHYIDEFSLHLKKRFQEFLYGIEDGIRMLSATPDHQRSSRDHFLGLLLSLAISFISVGLGRAIFTSNFIIPAQKLSGKSFNQLALMTLFLVIPLAFYFFVSILTGFLLEKFLSNSPVVPFHPSSYGALLPFNTYILWMGLHWIKMTLSPSRPSQALIPIDPLGAHQGAFWLRLAVIGYFLASLFLALIEILPLSVPIVHTILDTSVFFVSVCILRGLSILSRHLIPGIYTPHVQRGIFIFRWFVLLVCTLWLLDWKMLRQLFIPILSTILALLVTGPLGIMLRRLRVAFLWKRRNKGFFYKWLLKSGAWLIRGLHIVIYGSVLSIWMVHAWKGQHNFLVSLTAWGTAALASPFITRLLDSVIIFFSALLLDRGGVRLLRYYVEEKYTHDSVETNFFASRLRTLMAIFKTLIRVLVWIPAFSLIVSKFWDGHSLTAVLTSIGAASFGITFGFQGIVRDFITGFFLAVENNLMVGDQVEVDQRSGTVEAITMRTLKIRTDNGTLFTIPFGSINVIGNKNRGFAAVILNISVGYKEDLDKVQQLVEKAFSMLKKTPNVGRKVMSALEIRGIVEVTSYSVVFQAKVRTHPNDQDVVKRIFSKYLKQLFDEAGIVVPSAPYSVRFASPSLTNTSVP